jgi:hypothetical protein
VSSSGSIDENDIKSFCTGKFHGMSSHISCVLAISSFKQLDFNALVLAVAFDPLVEIEDVFAQLLYSAGSKGIARGYEDRVPIVEEFEGDFGEIGGFAYSVDTDKGDCVRTLFTFANG